MGLSKANEVLLLGKKQTAQELHRNGFIHKLFPAQDNKTFHEAIRKQVKEDIEGLDPPTLLKMKELIQSGVHEKNNKDAVNLRESYAQVDRFSTGVPHKRFSQLARKEIKHKL